MSAGPDFAPRYFRIEQELRARIAQARPHDPLPSEPELAREFGVSRMTARAAVTQLVNDGLAYRAPGRGTFVAVPTGPRRADNLIRLSEEIRKRGKEPSSRVVSAELRPATVIEATRLRQRAGDVVAIYRVRQADGDPFAFEHACYPGVLGALLDFDLSQSVHEALVALGRIPTRGTSTITAQPANEEDARELGVPAGTALLVEERLILDQEGRPLELSESRYTGTKYRLDVAFGVEPHQ
ncbi:GntR family transcriptional regulator [Actinoplanes sp. SE50]|uniref:GntR family transcriptional regulator n=1 Tax=unclassified Actinoplanes TaxID=2626549 RepID=UPI00023ECC06|nr:MULTISPECIES: GntR family transcriptional regulator [unclassified Actinoplanes]AEV81551.1 HTH-type transcriptional repressor yvoA [Actinoplanes sp. SE50/110]ATO79953.1 GntR family transcriptional regulator [Actinoplanes sp. SE50]SLL97355.1 GntR family transcriptional regulator [Actinoplanes sp. SE50/110]